MRLISNLILVMAFIGAQSCANVEKQTLRSDKAEFVIDIENGYNQTLYFSTIPFEGDTMKVLDSAFVKERTETIVFRIADNEEKLFRIYTADHRLDIVVINDLPVLNIKADYLDNGSYDFVNSGASSSLINFLKSASQKTGAAFNEALQNKSSVAQVLVRNYIDTVSSPAAALYLYDLVDFGKETQQLKQFVRRLAARFPDHSGINRLTDATNEFLLILDKEWKIGEIAPDLILPDSSGKEVALNKFRGRYVLLDIWASWDSRSLQQLPFNEAAFKRFKNKKLTWISIGLDPDISDWKVAIRKRPAGWIQLNDPLLWRGKAALTYYFDSIPFNYLLDPDGRIVAKALFKDSLAGKLEDLIK